jgi:hypothetical protein
MANVMRKREMLMLMLMATSFVQLGVCIDEEARTLSEVRELSYSNLRADAGINHQAWNFRTMLVEALITNRTLVLPIFFLHRDHNHGIQIHTQVCAKARSQPVILTLADSWTTISTYRILGATANT